MGTPVRQNSITATVIVNVIMNTYTPSFTNCPPAQNVTVSENATVNTRLFQLAVTDGDGPNNVSLIDESVLFTDSVSYMQSYIYVNSF